MTRVLLYVLRCIVPYELWCYINVLWLQHLRSKRLRQLEQKQPASSSGFEYEKAIAFMVDLTDNEPQVRRGSMPGESLNYAESFLKQLPTAKPLIGLHVGNFVGISLAFFVDAARRLHPKSIVFSIDPDVPFRDIENLQLKTRAILEHFDLNDNCAILTGYTLERSIADDSHDSQVFDAAPANQLSALLALGKGKFDFALIDGDHDGPYLKRELEVISQLVRKDGLLILDDVHPYEQGVNEVYAGLDPNTYTKLGADGRIGVVKRN